MDFEKTCTGYRVSLVKKTVVAGECARRAFAVAGGDNELLTMISIFLLVIFRPLSRAGRYTSEADGDINYACT